MRKNVFTQILKKSYDLIAKYYSTQKRVEWARLGMYITFCLAVDKIYLQSYFRENFKFYFQWSHSEPCDYVSLYQFQRYLDTADPAMLVQNSKFIIEKYYQV